MMLPPLALVQKACGIYIEDWLADVIEGRVSERELLEFCAFYRRMGITKLFLSGLPDAFFIDLYKSGRAYLYHIERQAESPITSHAQPFFDAMACNDLSGAKQIAERLTPAWQAGKEHEDAFWYMHFLTQHSLLDAPSADLEPLLVQFEDSLQGTADSRFDLCVALLNRDANSFDDAIQQLMDELERSYREDVAAETIDPDDAVTTRQISIEGLALARIAEQAGLETQREYVLIPSISRRFDRAHHPAADAWMRITSYYELS